MRYSTAMKRALALVFFALLISVTVAKIFLFEIPVVGGNDMAPSLQRGDRLLANRLRTTPERGDLVLMEHPQGKQLLIRRVVGLPGERVAVINELPHINGKAAQRRPLEQITLRDQIGGTDKEIPMKLVQETLEGVTYQVLKDPRRRSSDFKTLTLQGTYFVLADNRNHGTDSRTFGPVPAAKIRAVITHRLSAGPGSIPGKKTRPGFISLP